MTQANVQNNAQTFNDLYSNNFALVINDFPIASLNCVSGNIPGVTVEDVIVDGRRVDHPRPGDNLHWEPLVVTFIIDEYMQNYGEIFDWLGRYMAQNNENNLDDDILRDMTLVLPTNDGKGNIRVEFQNAYPKAIDSLDFDTRTTDPLPMTCTVTFSYTIFNIEIVRDEPKTDYRKLGD